MAVQYIEVVTCDFPECAITSNNPGGPVDMGLYDFAIGKANGRQRKYLIRVHLCPDHGADSEALFAHLVKVGERVERGV